MRRPRPGVPDGRATVAASGPGHALPDEPGLPDPRIPDHQDQAGVPAIAAGMRDSSPSRPANATGVNLHRGGCGRGGHQAVGARADSGNGRAAVAAAGMSAVMTASSA